MKQNWFGIFLFVTLFVSCLDEEEIKGDYPKIVTNDVSEISASGATLSGTIEPSALGKIIEYGFLWGQDKKLQPESSYSIEFGIPESNSVSVNIKSSLVAQKIYYARFYIKTNNKTVYGNVVSFKSLGSEGPKITALNPPSGVLGDTVVIHGKNFIDEIGKNVVKFDVTKASVLFATDSSLVVIVPDSVSVESEKVNVSVSIEGNTGYSPVPFTLLLSKIVPVIESISPHAIKACDTIIVVGKNFKSNSKLIEITMANDQELNLIKATDDSIMFSIKLLKPGEFDFTIKTGRFELRPSINFEELRPTFVSSSPEFYRPGDILTLNVKNFPTCFPFVVATGWLDVNIISTTENEVKIKLADYCFYGNAITFTFGVSHGDYFLYTPEITQQSPKILSVEPNHGTAGQQVVIHGENFFSLQEEYMSFLNITSYTDTEIRGTVNEVYTSTGMIDVDVNSCGKVVVLENGFQFDAPVISDFNPKTITSRDQVITISGANFGLGAFSNEISFSNSTSTTYANYDGEQLTMYASALIPDDLVETKFSTLITLRTPTGTVTTTVPLTIEYEGPWKKLKDFPGEARNNAIGFSIAGKGYAGLGEGVTDFYTTHLTDLWEYDPATDDWTQKASFPGMHAYDVNTTLVANDKAYYTNQNKEFWEYNPLSDQWEKKADYPGLASAGTIAVTINNKIYMGGGFKDGSTQVYDFWEYSPLLNTWLRVADAPSPVSKPQVFYERGGKMYTYSETILAKKYLLIYNPPTNVWTSQLLGYSDTKLTEQIFSFTDKVFVGRAYCCGGYEHVLTKINPTNNTSTTVPYRGPSRHWYTGFTIGNFGYIGFGRMANNELLKEIWRFDPTKF